MTLTPEQKQIRSNGIGASETPALMGLDPYKKPIDIYQKKLGLVESADNMHTRRGQYLEPALREWASSEIGMQFRECGTFKLDSNQLVIATPDGMTCGQDDRVCLEIKAPGPHTIHEWEFEAPDRYVVQLAQQMLVIGADYGYIVGLVGGELRCYKHERDKALEESIVETINSFWNNHVLPQVPPEADGTECYNKYIKHKFPRGTGQLIIATSEQTEMVLRRNEIKKYIEDKEAELELIEQQIKLEIGNLDGLDLVGYGRMMWKSNKDSDKVDYKALVEELNPSEELIKKYTKTVLGSRVLRFWPKKGK